MIGRKKPWHKQDGPMAGHLLEWLTAVSGHPDPLPDASHRALVCLALALDWRTGRGFTSAGQLAERAGCSEHTAQRATQWARDRGLLHREVRGHRRGDGSVTASGWEACIPPQPVVLGDPVWLPQPDAAGRLTPEPQPATSGRLTMPQPDSRDASTGQQRRLNRPAVTANPDPDLRKAGLSSPNKSSPKQSSPTRARPPAPAREDRHQEPEPTETTNDDQHSSGNSDHPHPAPQARSGTGSDPKELAFKIVRRFARSNGISREAEAELGGLVATMLRDGTDADRIRAALPAWHESGNEPPEALPGFVEPPR